jgi:RimJ/RimL family protein N-acetyltransferase
VKPPSLQTDRLILRRWRPEDLDAATATLADPQVAYWLASAPTRDEVAARMAAWEAQFDLDGVSRFAVERRADGALIGGVGLHQVDAAYDATPVAGAVEIGWHLDPGAWGQGYAVEAGAAVVRYGLDQLGLEEIVAFTAKTNARSRAVMERLGFAHQPWRDFDHPTLAPDHPLLAHVVYAIFKDAR